MKESEERSLLVARSRRGHWTRGLGALALLLVLACGTPNPLEKLKEELDRYPEYSVVLEDMKEGGNLTDRFYHQYRIVIGENEAGSDDLNFRDRLDDWAPVSEKMYREYQDFLGMAVLSKNAEGINTAQHPAGYQYVDNPRYGEWQRDSSGNSFWAFYGKYALLSNLFGTFRSPVYRSDWNDYRPYRGTRPYFGRSQQYGTRGTATRTTHRSFFERQQVRQQARNQKFGNKVQQRIKRSRMSGTRSRSGGRGGK